MNDSIEPTEEELATAKALQAIRDRAFEEGKRAGRLLGYQQGVEACRLRLAAFSTTPTAFELSLEEQEEAASLPLDSELWYLEITTRTRRALERGGIRTLRELLSTSSAQLERIRGLGPTGIYEIQDNLKEAGYAIPK